MIYKTKYNFIIYNLIIIMIFTFIYYYLSEKHFYIDTKLVQDDKISLIDYLNLSITIQSTVGLPCIKPNTFLSRTFVTIQQLLLVISLYLLLIDFI
jgi:hypothetical protein